MVNATRPASSIPPSQQLAADAAAVMLRVHVQPGDVVAVHPYEADHAIVLAGEELARAEKILPVLGVFGERDEGARIAGAPQLIRAGAVVDAADGVPVFVRVLADGDHRGVYCSKPGFAG